MTAGPNHRVWMRVGSAVGSFRQVYAYVVTKKAQIIFCDLLGNSLQFWFRVFLINRYRFCGNIITENMSLFGKD